MSAVHAPQYIGDILVDSSATPVDIWDSITESLVEESIVRYVIDLLFCT